MRVTRVRYIYVSRKIIKKYFGADSRRNAYAL